MRHLGVDLDEGYRFAGSGPNFIRRGSARAWSPGRILLSVLLTAFLSGCSQAGTSPTDTGITIDSPPAPDLPILDGPGLDGDPHAKHTKWTVRAGVDGLAHRGFIALDPKGNLLIAGNFRGVASFGTHKITANGGYDIFVAKANPDGTFLWAASRGGPGREDVEDLAVDSQGNIYVAGYFDGTSQLGGRSMVAKGDIDGFIVKMDESGKVVWSASVSGDGWDWIGAVATDPSGNIFVGGGFQKQAFIGTTKLSGKALDDAWLAKLDSTGNVKWASQWGDDGATHSNSVSGIDTDSQGSVFVTGGYCGNVVLGTTTLKSLGSMDVLVAKFDSLGSVVWASAGGGPEHDIGRRIRVGPSGSSVLTGHFQKQAHFGKVVLNANGEEDSLVASHDASGQFVWATSLGGKKQDVGQDIAVDPKGNVYVTGFISGPATFGNITRPFWGDSDVFVSKISPMGNHLWSTTAGGGKGDEGHGIVADSNGALYVAGEFGSTPAVFGGSPLYSKGQQDIFLWKIAPP